MSFVTEISSLIQDSGNYLGNIMRSVCNVALCRDKKTKTILFIRLSVSEHGAGH